MRRGTADSEGAKVNANSCGGLSAGEVGALDESEKLSCAALAMDRLESRATRRISVPIALFCIGKTAGISPKLHMCRGWVAHCGEEL